jgi:hypothetical protein
MCDLAGLRSAQIGGRMNSGWASGWRTPARRMGERANMGWMWRACLVAMGSAVLAVGCGAGQVGVETGRSATGGDPYEVMLIPETNAGWAGWCFFANVGMTLAGTCGGAQHHAAVISETWSGGGEPPETVGVALTTDAVVRVEIGNGISIPTHGEGTLPAGLRAAVIKASGMLTGGNGGLPHFIPVNASGSVIPQARGETPDELLQMIPTRRVRDPANPSPGVCQIKMRARPRLSADDGSVVTEVHRYSGIVGDGFITCASTSYELAGWPLLASVLLSASDPGAPPPPLPAMKPLPGHPGLFSAPGPERSGSEGELIGRRVRGGWLVVSRAKPAQRLALLEQLRATVDL